MKASLPFLMMAAMTLVAEAQRKLWTWESPLKDHVNYLGNINGSAVDSKGYSALLIGEWTWEENQPGLIRRHRVLWFSPNGSILHQEVIDRPEEQLWAVIDGFDLWKVLHVSATALAFTEGENLWVIKTKGKVKSRTVTEMEDYSSAFAANPPAGFAGWFQQAGDPLSEYPALGKTFRYQTPKSVSLWSIK